MFIIKKFLLSILSVVLLPIFSYSDITWLYPNSGDGIASVVFDVTRNVGARSKITSVTFVIGATTSLVAFQVSETTPAGTVITSGPLGDMSLGIEGTLFSANRFVGEATYLYAPISDIKGISGNNQNPIMSKGIYYLNPDSLGIYSARFTFSFKENITNVTPSYRVKVNIKNRGAN